MMDTVGNKVAAPEIAMIKVESDSFWFSKSHHHPYIFTTTLQAYSQKADFFKLNYFALLNFFVIKKAEYNQRASNMLENNHQFT